MRHLIAIARQRAGYSQAQLARRIGVSPALVAMIETGERAATPDTVARIARATGSPELLAAYCAACPVGRCQQAQRAA